MNNDHTSTPGSSAEETAGRPMRTVLSQFCEEFEAEVRPILEPLQRAVDTLFKTPESVSIRKGLHRFRDLRHEVQALVNKVAEQHAYVLIFGPLKSGKSTFMNAMCKAYVSEVTSLPAYPCMVYVSHADKPKFVVTHYDGATETFVDREALHRAIADGHRQLTGRIREVEARSEIFDPVIHMPEAIRKTDVKIPAGDLAKSGAVLVDTPGLYTRMKFGYDRMTRDFRNAAACAIFVVKADNLFLEQVFDEFNELLELFSRIFLIVNLDAAKKDLQPDGTLAPSLEHENPQEIITAFENLAMTTPLKVAADEGRLRIYPIDLLGAASRRILSQRDDVEDQGAEQPRGQADFAALLGDLTDYLNSNEYLKAFLDDSLRRSQALLHELAGMCEEEAVRRLNTELEALRKQQAEVAGRVAAVTRLQETQWAVHLQALRAALQDNVERRAEQIREETVQAAGAAVEEWFESSAGVGELIERIRGTLQRAQESMPRLAREALREQGRDALGGLSSGGDVLKDLRAVGVEVQQVVDAAIGQSEPKASAATAPLEISTEQIPVRRGMSDWLLLRSSASIRRRLFGPEGEPAAELSPAVKAGRLGEPARQSIGRLVDHELARLNLQAVQTLPERIFQAYCAELSKALKARLEQKRSESEQRLKQIEDGLGHTESTQQEINVLRKRVGEVSTAVRELSERFSQTEAALLTEPLAAAESR